jgi:3-methyladenine DNA glycosylase AlkD
MKNQIRKSLQANITIAPEQHNRFFKTCVGQYAEHDRFLGVTVPNIRKIAKNYHNLALEDIQELIASPFNEERLLALFIMIAQFQNNLLKGKIYQCYLDNMHYINNWNLVDASAHLIIGAYLHDKPKEPLFTLASSPVLWHRRIAIVATWWFIKQNNLTWTFQIAMSLLNDQHDLIHKAVGWMLREAGKKDGNLLINFLKQHKAQMPRTMLRYAIEKFSKEQRMEFLLKN